jgi:hypothetical protein
MAKFNQGNLVLTSSQTIIQGTKTIVNIDGAAELISLDVSGESILNSLQLETGATIVEFSIDGTLSGDSDTAVPTEKAVKTYVDTQIGGLTTNHNDLINLQGGDSTSSEYYHLSKSIHDSLYSASPLIGVGNQNTNVEVDYGNNIITTNINDNSVMILEELSQSFGSDTQMIIDQTSTSFIITEDDQEMVIGLTYDEQMFGRSDKVNIDINQNTNVLYIKDSSTNIGLFNTSLVAMFAGDASITMTDTEIELNTDEVTILDGVTSIASFATDYIDLNSDTIRMYDQGTLIGSYSTSATDLTTNVFRIFNTGAVPLATFTTAGLDFYYNGVKVAETTTAGITGAVWG